MRNDEVTISAPFYLCFYVFSSSFMKTLLISDYLVANLFWGIVFSVDA